MMWEQIRANRRKTTGLVVIMAALLAVLGYVIAEAYAPGAGILGLMVAAGIATVMSLVAYFQGDSILLAVSGAKKIEKTDHPQLYNVVEEMVIASGHARMPDIYIINDTALNAFAVGRNPDTAAVAITAGLLNELDRDELQGVMAHEMAHIVNRDVLLMTMLGVMLGAIVMLSEGFLRSLRYGGGRSARYGGSRSRGKGGGQGAALMAILAIVLAVLAPLLARLIYLAMSRRREFLADASAAMYTRYPVGLASALEKLGRHAQPVASANRATAPMYIVNPFKKAKLSAWTSTHPPIEDRVRILRSMGGVSYGEYQSAWQRVEGKRAGRLPDSALSAGAVPMRGAHPESVTKRDRLRETGDVLRKANGFLFIPCPCGARVKLPPEFRKDRIACPHCARALMVPVAALDTLANAAEAIDAATPVATPLRARRVSGEWQSIRCGCGAVKNLSPDFALDRTRCSRCGRTLRVESAP
jgi:heat shock protein HtpX